MSDKKTQYDVISKVIYEAKSYDKFEDIEKLVEVGTDLVNIPVQPLYMALHSTSSDQVANILPRLSNEQRQTMLDLDLWKRDIVNVKDFEFWLEAYTKCQDEKVLNSFLVSDDFFLYLRSRVNLWTFDTEDPQYPDHDYYFLTDDGLLLIEYSESYQYPNELKYLIRQFYAIYGVENAYAELFKLINDNFSILQEDAYQSKKERLREFGIVDYYEASQALFPFASGNQLKKFINQKNKTTAKLTANSLNQTLHSSALVSFESGLESLSIELNKVSDENRQNFLQFSFVRALNSTMVINDAFKASRVEQSKLGKYTKCVMELGLQYAKSVRSIDEDHSYLDYFDFIDLYKIGHGLLEINKKQIKKALKSTAFDQQDLEYFLGTWWCSFLENSFQSPPRVKNFGVGLHSQEVESLKVYNFWNKETQLFIQSLSLISQYYETFSSMRQNGQIHDSFYLNYSLDNIDFESILISSFINFSLGNSLDKDVNKLGLTISELKSFIESFFTKNGNEYLLMPLAQEEMSLKINEFIQAIFSQNIDGFDIYLHGVLSEHLSGYEFDQLEDEDFTHVGGPILLIQSKN